MRGDFTKILVMTDIHITKAGVDIIGLDPLSRFQKVCDAALAEHSDAEMLILMGDLTHHGEIEENERLKSVLDTIPLRNVPMLGNHDRRDAFLSVFSNATVDRHGFVQNIIDLPEHRLITLDTLDGPPYPKGHHEGRLCEKRMAWLTDALDGAGDRTPLIFAHHPPFDTGIIGMDAIKLSNGKALLDLLAKYSGVHLFCGHVHRTISGQSRGVPWTMFKGPCHQGVLDLKTADSSLSIDEPGAYGLLLLSQDGVVAHSQDVDDGNSIHRDAHSS